MSLPSKFKIVMECMTVEGLDPNRVQVYYRGMYFNGARLQFESESSDQLNQTTALTSEEVVWGVEIDNAAKTFPIFAMDVSVHVNLEGHSGFQPEGTLNFFVVPDTGSGYSDEDLTVPFFVWDLRLHANLDKWCVVHVSA